MWLPDIGLLSVIIGLANIVLTAHIGRCNRALYDVTNNTFVLGGRFIYVNYWYLYYRGYTCSYMLDKENTMPS